MKKLNEFLNTLMASFFGAFVGNTISNYREYHNFPEIYEMRSDPWYYYGALPAFYLFITAVVICVVIKLIIRQKRKR